MKPTSLLFTVVLIAYTSLLHANKVEGYIYE